MIFKNFSIPDELWDQFARRHKTDEQAREEILQCLRLYGKHPLTEKVLVLSPKQVRELNEMMALSISTGDELLKEIRHLLQVKVEGIDLLMDPELLAQLKQQAEFYERSLPEYLTELVQEKLALLIRGN